MAGLIVLQAALEHEVANHRPHVDRAIKKPIWLSLICIVLAPSLVTCRQTTARPSDLTEASVTKVVDGDTIEVDIEGKSYKVRYIAMGTPELHHPTKPVEYYAQEAYEKNREPVEGKTVMLEKDVSETDRYGRLLRYVYGGDVFVNA